jgi:uncharacterized protein YdhG (YjbR/CyaY superfamily)
MTKADPVQSHLSAFPAAQRRALESTRSALIRLLPGADEVIAWGMPSYRIDGDLVLSFSGFAEHNSLFPGAGAVALVHREFPAYPTTKGTIHLPRDSAAPLSLLRFVVRSRIDEINDAYPKSSGVVKAFYDNGILKHRGRMKGKQMSGAWEFFRKDGSLMRSGRFAEGKQVGQWTTYDRQGKPHKVTDFG